jgi:hypothetical protein
MWPLPDNDPFIEAMLNSRGEDKDALKKQIDRTIWSLRWRLFFDPWFTRVRIIRSAAVTLWSRIYGKYRKTSSSAHGSANKASHSSPGAGSVAAVQTGPNFAFTQPAAVTTTAGAAFESPIQDAGIRAGEIVGYRCWILKDGWLHSVNSTLWYPGVPMGGDPSKPCEGVHAFKDRLDVGAYSVGYSGSTVSGTVYLWGDVIEHERGWRASKAAIASIDDSPFYDAKALRKQYGLTKKRAKKT